MKQRKVKILVNVFQYVELLKGKGLQVRKGKLFSFALDCKRGIAQGRLPHGL